MIQHYDEVYHFTLRKTVALGVDPAPGQPSNYPMISENMNNLNDGNYLQTSSNTYAKCRLLHIPANSNIVYYCYGESLSVMVDATNFIFTASYFDKNVLHYSQY